MKDRKSTTGKIAELSKRINDVQSAINECDRLLRSTTPQDTAYCGPATFAIQTLATYCDSQQPYYTQGSFGMTMKEAREWIVKMVTEQRVKLILEYTACLNAIHETTGNALGPHPTEEPEVTK